MKFNKKHWEIVLRLTIITIPICITVILLLPGKLNPESYMDNPELAVFVQDVNEGFAKQRLYDNEKLSKDPRLFDVCEAFAGKKPSYFGFIGEEFSFGDLKTPFSIYGNWKGYYRKKIRTQRRLIERVALYAKEDKRFLTLFIQYLNSEDSLDRCSGVRALWILNDKQAVEPLISALKDQDKYVRFEATFALGTLNDKRAVAPLIATLNDKDDRVRSSAATSLRSLNDKRAIEPLIAVLKDDENYNVRSSAALALGVLRDKQAVEPLIAALNDKDGNVRSSAAKALGILGDKRARDRFGEEKAIAPLIAAMKDKDNEVRREVAEALGKLGDTRAVKPLEEAKNDEDKWVRSAAGYALATLPRTKDR